MTHPRYLPSVGSPIFRRLFGNERQREREELQQLYVSIRSRHDASRFSRLPALQGEVARAVEFLDHLSPLLKDQFAVAIKKTYLLERHIFEFPEVDFDILTMSEEVGLRDFLRQKEFFLNRETEIAQLLHEGIVRIFCGISDGLPEFEAPSPFTVPLIYAANDVRTDVTQMHSTLVEDEYQQRGLFHSLTRQLYENVCAATGVVPFQEHKKPLLHACNSKLPLDELNDTYLAGTPIHALFKTPVPLKFTYEDRFNHMHVVGGTGAGKTSLLESLILHDLHSDDPPSLVIVDSQTDLIEHLSHLALFDPQYGSLKDRLVLISPKDIRHPPALNIFDVNRKRLNSYDDVTKEQVIAGVIQTFDYLFAGLLGADLTAKQGVFFKYIARLMLALPETLGRNATILDMMRLMEDAAPYREAIESLPPIQRNFFERDFQSKTFVQTKEQIRYRLQAIIENPTLARLFTSPETRIDLFTEMNRGSIVLVDTAKDFLKGASSHFGRIFISLVLQAILERAALAENDRPPAFLIVDEAAAYFDSNIDDLLTDSRKYRCGCVFAHQYLDQCTQSLRASLAANTGIKFAAGVSNSDARALAADMRTTAEFILGQPRLNFAAHIRHTTPNAVSIPVKVGALKSQPRMSGEAFDRMRELNRAKVSLEEGFSPPPSETPKPQDTGLHRQPVPKSTDAPEDPSAASEEW